MSDRGFAAELFLGALEPRCLRPSARTRGCENLKQLVQARQRPAALELKRWVQHPSARGRQREQSPALRKVVNTLTGRHGAKDLGNVGPAVEWSQVLIPSELGGRQQRGAATESR